MYHSIIQQIIFFELNLLVIESPSLQYYKYKKTKIKDKKQNVGFIKLYSFIVNFFFYSSSSFQWVNSMKKTLTFSIVFARLFDGCHVYLIISYLHQCIRYFNILQCCLNSKMFMTTNFLLLYTSIEDDGIYLLLNISIILYNSIQDM